MNNSHTPASPCGVEGGTNKPADRPLFKGLTKREHFAAMAMQGFAANTVATGGVHQIVEASVIWADELLKELEK